MSQQIEQLIQRQQNQLAALAHIQTVILEILKSVHANDPDIVLRIDSALASIKSLRFSRS